MRVLPSPCCRCFSHAADTAFDAATPIIVAAAAASPLRAAAVFDASAMLLRRHADAVVYATPI